MKSKLWLLSLVTLGCSGAQTADLQRGADAIDASNGVDASAVSSDASSDGAVSIIDAATTVSDGNSGTDAPFDGGTADASDTSDASKSGADPCPDGASSPLTINCSSTCGVGQRPCSSVSCQQGSKSLEDPRIIHLTVPSLVRTPDAPGVDAVCHSACDLTTADDTPHRAYAMAFYVDTPAESWVRVRVGAPWVIQEYAGRAATYCASPTTSSVVANECLTVKSFGPAAPSRFYILWTDDPAAPARNIVVDYVQDLNGCP